jgi:hypothetical protein
MLPSSLQPATTLPSSRHPPQLAVPSRNALSKCILALRAKPRKPSLLMGECTGTSVTLWTGDIRYKSLAVPGLKLTFTVGFHRCF